MKHLQLAFCAFLISAIATPWVHASEADQAREIFKNHHKAVVTVELVVKQKFSMQGMPSQENESKVEATGTVIGADGLTVMALSTTDPTSIFRNMMAGSGRDGFQMDSQVSDVKILRHDNTEVPAQVILRDNNLDLAFVRPLEMPEEEFDYIDLNESGNPQILDNVVTLNRLGRVANRAHSASFERVEAVVERPRRFYIPGGEATTTATGSPAFALDGKPVGIFVIRSIRDTGGASNMFGGNQNVTAIILPARDILESKEQAPPWGEEPEVPAAEDEDDDAQDEAEEEDDDDEADEEEDEADGDETEA